MKKIFTAGLLLLSGFSFSQPKYKASDFNLSPDVAKFESIECTYDPDLKSYYVTNKQTFVFQKGLAQKIEEEVNYILLVSSITEFQYNGNQLIKSTRVSDDGTSIDRFKYLNGKLTEIQTEGDDPEKQTFEYDTKGNLIKDFTYKENNLILSSTYSEYNGKNTYFKKSVRYHNNKEDGTFESSYINGNLISKKINTPYYQENATYKYDKYGNVISETLDGKTFLSSFIYDEKGNILKAKVTRPGLESDDPHTNYFIFNKITFTNGKTVGTTDFDKDFIKKFE